LSSREIYEIVFSPKETSISKGKELTLNAISYIRVSTRRQSELDKSGVRKYRHIQIGLKNYPEYKKLEGLAINRFRRKWKIILRKGL
tara:strand:- start:337 stop:597 length:261 start_codon:yes stop_codon:yes gene_type:complete